jgi:predicted unusual protein kinase regulating ubiquinone biosynthesis (AarF/ABC1/UbiB family)
MMSGFLKIPYLRLKYRFFPDEAQRFWAQELLNAHGLPAKLGQVFSQGKKTEKTKSSLSREDARKILKNSFMVDAELGHEIHVASMGQVFVGAIQGKQYAMKVLHPRIKEKVQKEIDHVLLLGAFYAGSKGFHFDKQIFQRFLLEVFEEETDLVREGQFQKKFRGHFPDVIIPEVIEQFSNDLVLTQQHVPSTLAQDLDTIPDFKIFDFFFRSLLEHGLLHGDLNDRNWGHTGHELVVYDFGCTKMISDRRRNGLKKLLLNQDVKNAFSEFGVRLEATAFNEREQELRDALFGPLRSSLLPDHSYSKNLEEQFGDSVKSLREFCDPWILLLLRSLFSLIKVYQRRNIAIPLGEILAPLLMVQASGPKTALIRIEVLENTKQVVFLTLPLAELENLPQLIPSKVMHKLPDVNLQEIIARVIATKYTPQILFHSKIDLRSYKVWIE